MRAPIYGLTCCLLTASFAWPTDLATDRLSIGDGYNSATGDPGGNCVAFNPSNEASELYVPGGVAGQRTLYDLYEITTLEQLKTSLNVSASASFDWGIFSGDASYQFMRSGTLNSYSNYLFVRVRVANPTEIIKRKSLSSSALQYASQGRFFQTCGNEFIYARTTGGDLTALVEFSSNSTTEHEQVSTSVNLAVNGFLASGGGGVAMSQALDQLKSVSRTRVHIIRNGGLGDIPDLSALKTAALAFPKSVQLVSGHPVVALLLTQPYTTTDNLPADLNFDLVRYQMDTLPRLAAWLDDAYKIRGDLKYILDHSSQFFIKTSDVSVLWNKNEDLIQSLLSTAEVCRTAPQTGCKLPPPPDFADIQAIRNRACDLNHDGKIDEADVNLLIANVLGNGGVRADLNNDGKVNIVDVQILVNAAIDGQCRLRN
jgi:hypothetical protein